MKNGNVYSQLLDMLRPVPGDPGGCVFGTITNIDPLTVRVGGETVSGGLFRPRGMALTAEDVGAEAALLPCESGLVLLFPVEGGNDT